MSPNFIVRRVLVDDGSPMTRGEWQRVKRVAYGFTLQVGNKQIRKSDASWTKEAAENAEAEYRLGIGLDQPPHPTARTFGAVATQYLEVKRGKASWKDQERTLERLLRVFGRDSLVSTLTAERIAQYQAQRRIQKSARRRDADGIAPGTARCARPSEWTPASRGRIP